MTFQNGRFMNSIGFAQYGRLRNISTGILTKYTIKNISHGGFHGVMVIKKGNWKND